MYIISYKLFLRGFHKMKRGFKILIACSVSVVILGTWIKLAKDVVEATPFTKDYVESLGRVNENTKLDISYAGENTTLSYNDVVDKDYFGYRTSNMKDKCKEVFDNTYKADDLGYLTRLLNMYNDGDSKAIYNEYKSADTDLRKDLSSTFNSALNYSSSSTPLPKDFTLENLLLDYTKANPTDTYRECQAFVLSQYDISNLAREKISIYSSLLEGISRGNTLADENTSDVTFLKCPHCEQDIYQVAYDMGYNNADKRISWEDAGDLGEGCCSSCLKKAEQGYNQGYLDKLSKKN